MMHGASQFCARRSGTLAKRATFTATAIVFTCSSHAAFAQMSKPSIVSALPDVSRITRANAAGVLQYCMSNNLVSSAATDRLVAPLLSTPGLAKSADYSAGHQGRIIAAGKTFSIRTATPFLQSEACSIVFKQAKTFK